MTSVLLCTFHYGDRVWNKGAKEKKRKIEGREGETEVQGKRERERKIGGRERGWEGREEETEVKGKRLREREIERVIYCSPATVLGTVFL